MATILIVDDDPAVLRLTSMILERNGYGIVRASNGLEALMLYTSYAQRLDLVLTDVDMPEMDGVELASRIRSTDPSAKVLLMSGRIPEGVQPSELDRVLLKPFRTERLLTAVRQVLSAGEPS